MLYHARDYKMPQLIKFPHIEQLRHCVATVRHRAAYHNEPLPSLVFKGTPKLHGTNASICIDVQTGEVWCQSRETIITPEQDNCGFARWTEQPEVRGALMSIFEAYFGAFEGEESAICIYGEWCGQGVMKGVGISQLPKMFVIFGVKATRYVEEFDLVDGVEVPVEPEHKWMSQSWSNVFGTEVVAEFNALRIFDINQFQKYSIKIDFTDPEASVPELTELTQSVEKECPVAREFGISGGLGEGIVWTCDQKWYDMDRNMLGRGAHEIKTSDLRFKTKGEKHKEAAHEKIAADPVKVANIKAFVDGVVTEHRLEKMIEKLKMIAWPPKPEYIPQFLQLVGEDVLREEGDVLVASGLDRKDVMKAVNFSARNWFLQLCKAQPI